VAEETLSIVSELREDAHYVAPSGELDIATVELLERALLEVERADSARIVLDLSGVSFIDSTGLRLLPWTATPMLVAPVAGALADRIGTRPLLVTGLVLQAGGLAWVAALASAGSTGYGLYVVPFLIAGVGISMAIPTVPTAALGAVSPADVGQASGVSNTMQRFGGAFAIALVSAIFAAHGHLGSAASFTAGYRPAMLGSAGLSLVGAVVAIGIGRRRVASPPRPAPAEAGGVPLSAAPEMAR